LVRVLLDAIAQVPGTTDMQLQLCTEQVEWCRAEKRTFLRQRIEIRLASLYVDTHEYNQALPLIAGLLREVKRLDDKLLLVDIHLIESRCHHELKNFPKARAALTAARTAANSVYVPPLVQADIDMQSGTLHAEDHDYATACSYFYEAFEALSSLEDKRTVAALKYMLLSKIMDGDAEEVPGLIASKGGLKWAGPPIEAMREVAKASQERSLELFQRALDAHPHELKEDLLISHHLDDLWNKLLEENLLKIIEPYTNVEVSHVAKQIKLPVEKVQQKLAQMILDKRVRATLDQGAGCLEIFEEAGDDSVLQGSLDIFTSLGRVVDTLFTRSRKVVA